MVRHPELYKRCSKAIVDHIRETYKSVNAVVAPEATGFLFSAYIASELELPFIPIRKEGKLSGDDLLKASYKKRTGEVRSSVK